MTDVIGQELVAPPATDQAGPSSQLAETAVALRWLRAGLSEETMRLELPPDIRATISPIVSALRWGALLYGMVYASTQANAGEINVVFSLSVAMFLTVWRTFRPLFPARDDRLACGKQGKRPQSEYFCAHFCHMNGHSPDARLRGGLLCCKTCFHVINL